VEERSPGEAKLRGALSSWRGRNFHRKKTENDGTGTKGEGSRSDPPEGSLGRAVLN